MASLTDQINAVIAYANRNGFPDAADWITRQFYPDEYEPEPSLDNVGAWVKWYRVTYNTSIEVAYNAYRQKKGTL